MVPFVTISPIAVAEVVGDVGVGGQISLIRHIQPSTMPILPVVVAQASLEPISASSALIGLGMVPLVPLATVSSIMVLEVTCDDGFGDQRSWIRHTWSSTMSVLPVVVA